MGPLSMQKRAHHIRWSQVPTTLNSRLLWSYLQSKTSLNKYDPDLSTMQRPSKEICTSSKVWMLCYWRSWVHNTTTKWTWAGTSKHFLKHDHTHKDPQHTLQYLCLLWFTPILFFGLIFSFLAITHPSHVIGPLTTLVFIITSFHPIPHTSMTHLCLHVCTSLRFHHIPPSSICFIITPELSESQVYKPSTCYVLP